MAGRDEAVEDAGGFVRQRGDSGGPAELGAQALVVFAEFVLSVVQRLRAITSIRISCAA